MFHSEPIEIKCEQYTPEWYAARKGKITASLVPAIMGEDEYIKRSDVLDNMVKEFYGIEVERRENPATLYGRQMEEFAAYDYERIFNCELKKSGFWISQSVPYLGCSLDRVMDSPKAIVEIKSLYGQRDKEVVKFERKKSHDIQCHVQMFVTNILSSRLFQWTPHAWNARYIPYSQKFMAEILEAVESFYDEYLEEIEKQREIYENH